VEARLRWVSQPPCFRSTSLTFLTTCRFPTCAIAKRALVIPNPTIRGYPVSITVPKRFFQKTADVPSRDTVEAGLSAYSRFTSNPNNREGRNRASSIQEGSDVTSPNAATKEKTSYSPQDARSGLPKKKKGKQTQQTQITAGSPEARKAKPKELHQESPTEEEPAVSAVTVKTDDSNDSAKLEGPASSASMTVEPIISTVSEETAQPQVGEKTPPTVVKEMDARPAGTEAIASKLDTVGRVSKAAPSRISPALPAPSVEPTVEPTMVRQLVLHTDLCLSTSTLTDYLQTSLPQPKTTTATKVPASASTPLEVQDPTSDDELKNEASFHSAAESQSELDVKGVLRIGSAAANHGTDVRVPQASTTMIISYPAPAVPTTYPTQEPVNAPTEDVAATTNTENSQSKQESKTTTIPSVTSEAAEVQAAESQAATQQEIKAPTTTTLVVGQTKKRGPQQPEPFFLSHRQLAKQAKKEREKQKKAEKRKEKLAKQVQDEDESAPYQVLPAYGPSGNAEGSTDNIDTPKDKAKSAGDIRSVKMTATRPATTPDTKDTSASTEESTPTKTSQKTVDDNRGTSGKGKGKKVAAPAAEELASTEDKNKDHSKQTNGTSVTPETGSVTNKEANANPEKAVQGTSIKETTQESVPGMDAQSSKQDDSKEVTSGSQGSDPVGAGNEGSTSSGKRKKNKKKKKDTTLTEGERKASKQPLAWPNLDFRPKSPNPAWMGPIDMETDVHNYEKIMDGACGGPDDSDFSWTDLPTMEDVLSSDKDQAPASPAGGSKPPPSSDADGEGHTFNVLYPKLKKLRPNKVAETFARLVETNTPEAMARLYVYYLAQLHPLLTLLLSVTDDAALVAKVDEATQPSKHVMNAHDDDLRIDGVPGIAALTGISAHESNANSNREELVNRGIAALAAQIGKQPSHFLDHLLLTSTAARQEKIKVTDAGIAANGKQHAEPAAGHDPSDSFSPETQPPKKKKVNKHNNKKKKKKTADDGEPSQLGKTVGTTATAPTPSTAAADPVDPSDPFARQLNHVDAVIDLNQNEAAASGSVSLRGGAATPVSSRRLQAWTVTDLQSSDRGTNVQACRGSLF
jgi:hypothetical protein